MRQPYRTNCDRRPPVVASDSLSALFTDLYELTMARAYQSEDRNRVAVFELFVRRLPKRRNYLVAAGLEAVLDFLEDFRFDNGDLAFLWEQGQFDERFLDVLRQIRFTGDVYAVPEGTVIFENEPLLQVVAPILEAQLIETMVLNQLHLQTLLTTKAARIVTAAAGKPVVDFGSRRAHGTDAALKVARCSYLAWASGTSNTLAGRKYGIPVAGTMAHSYVQAHNDEERAFREFAKLYPGTTLLVDTFDTIEGVRRAVNLSRTHGRELQIGAVRLDSGDLLSLSKRVRRILDDAGLQETKIIASSGLDEYSIEKLVAKGAPIDSFGVGTQLAVSGDAPDLDMVYKLVEFDGEPRAKFSSGKVLYPGRKQIFRTIRKGRMVRDVVTRVDEQLSGEALLIPVMKGGMRLAAGRVAIKQTRQRTSQQLRLLPDDLRLTGRAQRAYPVDISPRLTRELDSLKRRHEKAV